MINNKRKNGIALVITLVVLTILTISVVAFLSSVSMDLKTSRALANFAAAEAVANGAQAEAEALLEKAISENRDYITFLAKDPDDLSQPYVVIAQNSDTPFSSPIPLVSYDPAFVPTASLVSTESDPTKLADGFNKLFTEKTNEPFRSITLEGYDKPFRIPLKEIAHSSVNQPGARYGYVLIDAQARINPLYHRGADRSVDTNYPADSSGIPLYFGSSLGGLTDTEITNLSTQKLFAPSLSGSAEIFDTGDRAKLRLPFMALYEAVDEHIIPSKYPDGGRPKWNINDLAVNPAFGATPTKRAENIAAIIDRNLPEFKHRDMSFSAPSDNIRYLNRIAASIVDYIDPTTIVTTVNGGEPAGRGRIPYAVVIADQYRRTAQTTNSATVQNRVYVQLWNPHSTAITGTAQIRLFDRQRVTFGTGLVMPLGEYTGDTAIALGPNEIKVFEFPLLSFTFTSPDPVPNSDGPRWGDTVGEAHVPFQLQFNGALIDMNRRPPLSQNPSSGMQRNSKTLNTNGFHYQASLIPTQGSQANTASRRFVGDPRGTFLSSYFWQTLSSDNAYANSVLWNGRQQNVTPRHQEYDVSWQSRDHMRIAPRSGNSAGNINTPPTSASSPYDPVMDGKNAPFYVRKNAMRSIAELGNIYDPAQVDDIGASPTAGVLNTKFVSGGGRTLRIGRPENTFWDVEGEGKSSVQLMDLFTTYPVDQFANSGYPQSRGAININTASREVLSALFYDIAVTSDQGGISIPNPPKVTSAAADELADLVISQRNVRPFRRLSDLKPFLPKVPEGEPPLPPTSLFLELDKGSNFNPAITTLSLEGRLNVPNLMDRGREEVFRKVLGAIGLQSRAYIVIAVGQQLGRNDRVVSEVISESLVIVDPRTTGLQVRRAVQRNLR